MPDSLSSIQTSCPLFMDWFAVLLLPRSRTSAECCLEVTALVLSNVLEGGGGGGIAEGRGGYAPAPPPGRPAYAQLRPPDAKCRFQWHLEPTVTAPNRFGNRLQPPAKPLLGPPLPFPSNASLGLRSKGLCTNNGPNQWFLQ